MDISCHSFIRMARLAKPLMKDGGVLFTMSFYGAHRVVEHYNLMGPVKAALEASAKYLAAELASSRIRVYVISPGPLKTRAASGIKAFDEMLTDAAARAPAGELVTIDDVGIATAVFAGDGAKLITGQTIYVDGGTPYHGVTVAWTDRLEARGDNRPFWLRAYGDNAWGSGADLRFGRGHFCARIYDEMKCL